MKKEIVILTLSNKYGGVCVAGLDMHSNEFVRIVDNSNTGHNSVSRNLLVDCEKRSAISIFDVVSINNINHAPTNIHPENYTITENTEFSIIGRCEDIDSIYENCPKYNDNSILGNTSHKISGLEESDHSLEMVPYTNGKLYTVTSYYNGKVKTKFSFIYNGVYYSEFSVTDPDEYLHAGESINYNSGYIVVSIPDDAWSRENGFYKFAATIFHD